MQFVSILLVLAVPFLELGLLIQVGQIIGFWWTMALIIATALVGIAALTQNGVGAPWRMQEAMRRGETPVASMFDAGLMATAGILLITPGIIADTIGLLLLIPFVRRLVARWIARNFFGGIHVETGFGSATWRKRPSEPDDGADRSERPRRPRSPGAGPVIDGEYERLGERTVDPSRRPDGDKR